MYSKISAVLQVSLKYATSTDASPTVLNEERRL